MNDHPKRNTPAGEAPQRATSGQNVPKSGERANAGTRRRNGAGSLFGENGKGGLVWTVRGCKVLDLQGFTSTEQG